MWKKAAIAYLAICLEGIRRTEKLGTKYTSVRATRVEFETTEYEAVEPTTEAKQPRYHGNKKKTDRRCSTEVTDIKDYVCFLFVSTELVCYDRVLMKYRMFCFPYSLHRTEIKVCQHY
jgi:hypothetical protein